MAETEIVFSVLESAEGGYEARALGHSIHTQAETLAELKEALKDAVRCHFGDADQPKLIRLQRYCLLRELPLNPHLYRGRIRAGTRRNATDHAA